MNKFRKPHEGGGDRGGFGKPSFRPSFDRPRFGSKPDRGFEKQKFDAICSHCGKPCQVPFRPNGTRPVYCSVCFNSERGGSSIRPSEERGSTEFSRTNVSRDRTPAFQNTNKPENAGMPFAPHQSHRNDSRELANAPFIEDRRIDDMKKQLNSMSSKLDSILRAVTVPAEKANEPIAEAVKPADERRRGGTEPSSGERTEPKKRAVARKK